MFEEMVTKKHQKLNRMGNQNYHDTELLINPFFHKQKIVLRHFRRSYYNIFKVLMIQEQRAQCNSAINENQKLEDLSQSELEKLLLILEGKILIDQNSFKNSYLAKLEKVLKQLEQRQFLKRKFFIYNRELYQY
ncbi:unnamed protein product [Paramecium octaurelia]|uniref:Uncharacterized protein n=1 Tax=Paramecium octaurelia TaxID=43137 RepID=A0A8S1WUB7_PAROT|nr:unnamed protein product [Paramecium octaurelia]